MPDIEKLVGLTITDIDVHKGAEDGTGFVYLHAIGADETPDIDDEIFDYKTSKPYVEAWSEASEESTKAAGQAVSYGNVRAQHGAAGAQNAAGTICEPIKFDDKDKRVSLRIKVVDSDAITKVQEGVYRGVSIKGRLVGKKWKDGNFYRYTVDPVEFSLVDKPANPNATITIVKADGSTEIVEPAEETRILKAATLLQEMSLDEVKELITMAETKKTATQEEIEKASAVSKMKAARKAHNENGSCVGGYCDHGDTEKCMEKVAENHKVIEDAFRSDKKKSAEVDSAKAAKDKEKPEEEEEEEGDKEDDGKKAKKAKKEDGDGDEDDKKKAAESDEIKALKEQVKTLTETVEKMAGGKNDKRPTPVHPGSKVVTKADDGAEINDILARKAKLDKSDPDYVAKAAQIDHEAEHEVVKL